MSLGGKAHKCREVLAVISCLLTVVLPVNSVCSCPLPAYLSATDLQCAGLVGVELRAVPQSVVVAMMTAQHMEPLAEL